MRAAAERNARHKMQSGPAVVVCLIAVMVQVSCLPAGDLMLQSFVQPMAMTTLGVTEIGQEARLDSICMRVSITAIAEKQCTSRVLRVVSHALHLEMMLE